MKKTYILLSIILSSLSFSLGIFDKPNKEAHTWYTFQEVAEKIDQLKPYDLVVLDVGPILFQKYGHIFVVNKDKKFVEIKGADNIFADEPIYEFFKLNRKISIFRYKEIDDKLRDVLEEDVKKYYNKEYSILSTSDSEDINSYCSKFVYTLFLDAGKKLNRDTRLFPDKFPILPFDFLETTTLDNIILK